MEIDVARTLNTVISLENMLSKLVHTQVQNEHNLYFDRLQMVANINLEIIVHVL